jgi:hypothetical protein
MSEVHIMGHSSTGKQPALPSTVRPTPTITRSFWLLSLVWVTLAVPGLGQDGDTCALAIGMNLAGPSDYGSEWPFVNIMKYARTWGTTNVAWVEGGENMFDTELIDSIAVDSNGYPLELPVEIDHPNADTAQCVFTIWANAASLLSGTYVLLYDGQGVIDFWGDATITNEAPGRLEVEVTTGEDAVIVMYLKASTPGNHLRNLRFLMPGTEATYQVEPFCAAWLEKLEPFQYLRFMDWGYTNNSELRHWSDRPHVDDYTYTQKGVPYEWMIELCNRKGADPWVCVPHQADHQFIAQMATLFRDNLDPGRTIYVEYSNELWNWMFTQAQYGLDSLNQNLDWPERLGPKIEAVMAVWDSVFAGQTERLVRVVGAQLYWPDIVDRILSQITPGKVDAIATGTYVGLEGDSLNVYGADLTVETVFYLAQEEFDLRLYPYLVEHRDIADAHNLKLLHYEGGQHFTPEPFGSEQPYNDVLVAAQTDPAMYALYDQLLDTLSNLAEGGSSLFMHFSFITPQDGQYGSWGALVNQFTQSPPYDTIAPKYQALLDHLCETGLGMVQNGSLPAVAVLTQNYPNPFNASTTIRYVLPRAGEVRLTVYDLRGRRVAVLLEGRQTAGVHAVAWDASRVASGIYFYRLSADAYAATKKCVVLK